MDTTDTLRARLNAIKGQWPAITQQHGLPYSWLTKFALGRFQDSGARRLEKLRSALDAVGAPTAEELAASPLQPEELNAA